MSRADSGGFMPMSYPVDPDELVCALHRLIAHKRATMRYGHNVNYVHNANASVRHSMCQCGKPRRTIQDMQIDIPEAEIMPAAAAGNDDNHLMDVCKQFLLANGYLLPMLLILGLIFYLAWISLNK